MPNCILSYCVSVSVCYVIVAVFVISATATQNLRIIKLLCGVYTMDQNLASDHNRHLADLITCLGSTGDPPYHWTSALHSLSGTKTMSTPFSLLTADLSFPPSAVRLVTLPALPPDDWRIRQALSMGPGRAGMEDEPLAAALPCLECLGEGSGVEPRDPPAAVEVATVIRWRAESGVDTVESSSCKKAK